MALDDRDYMREGVGRPDPHLYDPKEYRGPTRAAGEELLPGWSSASGRKGHRRSFLDLPGALLQWLLLLAIAFLVVGTIIHRNDPNPFQWTSGLVDRGKLVMAGESHRPPPAKANEVVVHTNILPLPRTAPPAFQATQTNVCAEQAPNASGFWGSSADASGPSTKWVRISNFVSTPALFVLARPSDGSRVATAFVRPGESAVMRVREVRLSMSMSFGSKWCNRDTGWLDGVRTNIVGGVEVAANSRGATLELRPDPAGGSLPKLMLDQEWIVGAEPGQATTENPVGRHGSIGDVRFPSGTFASLTRTQQGYSVNGSIAGVPVTFMVDTGATITSVPEGWARSFGVSTCVARMFMTANGKTQGCVARVSSITFGPFEVRGAEVAFMKNLHTALLGMNALQQMQMVEQGRDMVLRER